MKPVVVAACLLLTAGSVWADNPPATPGAAATTTTTPTTPGTKPPANKTTPAKPPVKKEEPMGKIAGTEIARGDGTFLGLEVVNGNFRLTFYDKKKKPMAIPAAVSRGTARWPNNRTPHGDYHTVLNPVGSTLVGQHPVLPPFTFNVFITLQTGDGEESKTLESYNVPFRN